MTTMGFPSRARIGIPIWFLVLEAMFSRGSPTPIGSIPWGQDRTSTVQS